jgi:hypothetical protein
MVCRHVINFRHDGCSINYVNSAPTWPMDRMAPYITLRAVLSQRSFCTCFCGYTWRWRGRCAWYAIISGGRQDRCCRRAICHCDCFTKHGARVYVSKVPPCQASLCGPQSHCLFDGIMPCYTSRILTVMQVARYSVGLDSLPRVGALYARIGDDVCSQ